MAFVVITDNIVIVDSIDCYCSAISFYSILLLVMIMLTHLILH